MGRLVLGALLIVGLLLGMRQFSEMRKGSDEEATTGAAPIPTELIAYISHGERVDIAAMMPQEGLAVVEFTADW